MPMQRCRPKGTACVQAPPTLTCVVVASLRGPVGSVSQDVRRLSLDTLCKLCQHAGRLIRPFIPDVVATLIEALSALEPQALNYLTFHVDKFDMSSEQVQSRPPARLPAACAELAGEGGVA